MGVLRTAKRNLLVVPREVYLARSLRVRENGHRLILLNSVSRRIDKIYRYPKILLAIAECRPLLIRYMRNVRNRRHLRQKPLKVMDMLVMRRQKFRKKRLRIRDHLLRKRNLRPIQVAVYRMRFIKHPKPNLLLLTMKRALSIVARFRNITLIGR